MDETAHNAELPTEDGAKQHTHVRVEKYHDAVDGQDLTDVEPDEVVESEGNLLMFGGASCQWETLIGNGTGTAGQALTYFNSSNAAIGTGDSTTAAAGTQTDLQAATNKLRKLVTSVTHSDGTASGNASIVFAASFGTSEGNYHWQEWGLFNSPTAATGRMLNRKVTDFGTKVSGTWVITVTLSMA